MCCLKVQSRGLPSGLPDGIHILKTKIPIWINYGGSCNGRCRYILWPFGLFFGHLVYFTAIMSILHTVILCVLWPSGIFSGCLLHFTHFGMLYHENLAALSSVHLLTFRLPSSSYTYVGSSNVQLWIWKFWAWVPPLKATQRNFCSGV
jgi:hypothetical protein